MHHVPRVLLTLEGGPGGLECEGFDDVASPLPALIEIKYHPDAWPHARDLRDYLRREILRLGTAPKAVPMTDAAEAQVRALTDPERRKLLVYCGSGTAAGQPPVFDPYHFRMLGKDPLSAILPVFPRDCRTRVFTLLTPEYTHLNVCFWRLNICEATPSIFALAGMTHQNPRLFISYRQKESAKLALQLFDALSHAGFDPFLDHLRIPPGVDFQSRLTQELGDKSVVVVIESAGILDSEWTLYEINTARKWQLGLFAIHPPGGRKVDGIDDSARYLLHPHHLKAPNAPFDGDSELTDDWRDHLVQWIRTEHDRAMAGRASQLRADLSNALSLHGVAAADQHFDPTGALHVARPYPNGSDEYLVWLATRPPEVLDFFYAFTRCQLPDRAVLIGLSALMERNRREVHDWLGRVSRVTPVDQGRLAEAAAQIARGAL